MSSSQPVELRPYQQSTVADIRAAFINGKRRLLFVLPTGGGKTVILAYVVHGAAARGKRVCILVHRQELVEQVDGALKRMGVRHGITAAGHPETDHPVQIASVASLLRRLDRIMPFDLIVADEAHHAVAGSWQKIIQAMPNAYVLGVTATPERLDGRGLGDVFETMICGPSVEELTALKFLVPAQVFAPSTGPDLSALRTRGGDYAIEDLSATMSAGALVGDAVEHYARTCRGKSAVAFCVDRAHSRLVASRFTAAGFRAAHVDGETNKEVRRDLIANLGTGELDVLCNCGLISEGVDVPSIGAAILLRPTKSFGLYLQMVGRALRPAPGKTSAVILDHAGNAHQHGHPADPLTWSLDSKKRRSREMREPVRRCDECGAAVPLAAINCQNCGAELKHTPRELEQIAGQLVEVERQAVAAKLRGMSYGQLLRWAADDEERLRTAARARGYHRGWVRHVLTGSRANP